MSEVEVGIASNTCLDNGLLPRTEMPIIVITVTCNINITIHLLSFRCQYSIMTLVFVW